MVIICALQFVWSPALEALTDDGVAHLNEIHSRLKLIHGKLLEEYPEQLMAAMFLPSNAKVIELGANVGRNTCVIGTILNDSRNLVAIESSKESAKLLQENRDYNQLQFHIEASAISKVRLIQSGWVTIPSEIDYPGYSPVDTITFDEVQKKYQIIFDTMVADCEGALYYILRDDPKILKNIKLILVENDYSNFQHFQYVIDLFRENGFQLVYNRAGGWGPCEQNFYQVWKK